MGGAPRIGRSSGEYSAFVVAFGCDIVFGTAFRAVFSASFDLVGEDLEGPPIPWGQRLVERFPHGFQLTRSCQYWAQQRWEGHISSLCL